jgi:hypothetical protein
MAEDEGSGWVDTEVVDGSWGDGEVRGVLLLSLMLLREDMNTTRTLKLPSL